MEQIMKTLFALWLLAGGLLLGAVGVASAQDDATSSQRTLPPTATQNDNFTPLNSGDQSTTSGSDYAADNPAQANANVRTLTGCLQEGAGADEYTLFGRNANWWELVSNSVDLAAHVGQLVEIAYVPQQNAGNNGANRPLVVTDLVMVSSGCSWY
jgi:hypothetical protein